MFSSKQDFLTWKKGKVYKSKSKFVPTCGKRICADGREEEIYQCHRSGNPRLIRNRQRMLKTQGSNKINKKCTAFILLTSNIEKQNSKLNFV